MGNQISLVIFDCDGVLVDSEMLSAGVLMQMMAEEDMAITTEIFQKDFLGRSFGAASLRVAGRFGRALPADFQMRYRTRLLAKMRLHLQPMLGVVDMLQNARFPYCLATGSSPERLALALETTGLTAYFKDRSFTASQVRDGKPAPDLFLFAADVMKAAPAQCLVIEDSEMGIRAAIAAGMRVWHFAGGSHVKAGYQLPQDLKCERVVDSMPALREALFHENFY